MAGVGRPKGSRKMRNAEAVVLLHKWREDHPARITEDTAFNLTDGLVGQAGSETLVSLAAVAVRYVARKDK